MAGFWGRTGRKSLNMGKDVLTLGASGQINAQNKALKGQLSDIDKQKQELIGQNTKELNDISNTFDPWTANASEDFNAYRTQAGRDLSEYEYDPWQDFDLASADKYIDPELEAITKDAIGDIEGSAANRGMLFSGKTGKDIVAKSSQIRSDARQKAIDLARQDWTQKQNYGMGAKNQGLNLQNTRLNNLQNLSNIGQGAVNNSFTARQNANNVFGSNMANLNSSASQLNANLNSAPGFGTQFLQALPSRIQMAKDIASMSSGATTPKK